MRLLPIPAGLMPRVSLIAGLLFARALGAQQVADSAFDVSVKRPAWTAKHPRVVIDETHRNFHTATGRYWPFARLLRNDGYVVDAGITTFSRQSLRGVDVLVIANALGGDATPGS